MKQQYEYDESTHGLVSRFPHDFPDELLLRVIHFLADEGSSRTPNPAYSALSLTCTLLHRIVADVLYEKYEHRWDVSSASFINTMIVRPDLALKVKAVKETGPYYDWPVQPQTVMTPYFRGPNQLRNITNAIQQLDISKRGWLPRFETGNDVYSSLETALLICHTPNLSSLAINSTPWTWPAPEGCEEAYLRNRQPPMCLQPIIHAAQGFPYGRVHAFSNLKTLEINMCSMQVSRISSVLRLPSLQILILSRVTESQWSSINPNIDEVGINWECPPRTSNVVTLCIEKSILWLTTLRSLVLSCKRLKTLSLHFIGDKKQYAGANIMNIIEHHQESLQNIELHTYHGDMGFVTGLDSYEKLRTLQHFSQLKYLRIDARLFADRTGLLNPLVEYLPSGLQTLVLSLPRGCQASGYPDVLHKILGKLLHAIKSRVVNFRTIAVDYEDITNWGQNEITNFRRAIEDCMKDAGTMHIRFEFAVRRDDHWIGKLDHYTPCIYTLTDAIEGWDTLMSDIRKFAGESFYIEFERRTYARKNSPRCFSDVVPACLDRSNADYVVPCEKYRMARRRQRGDGG
jgi:hypothetical protein